MMNKLSAILRCVCAVFLFLFGLIFMPSMASILFLLAGLLVLPVPKLREFINCKLKLSRKLKIALVVILFVAGMLSAPATQDNADNNIAAQAETETISGSEAIIKEEAIIETETETEIQTETEAIVESEESTEQPTADSTFSVKFIDVGQADAAIVECDGHYMLIDGGNKADSDLIYSVLKKADINHLDIVAATHAHEDHVGGLAGAFNYAAADVTLCPADSYDSEAFSDFKKYCDEKGGGITIPSVGDEYKLGSASVQILGVNGGEDTNDTSIILKIIYGQTSFLFTGDAEREAEQAVLNSGADLSATVLKVGHHGSDTSTTYPFLREIMPQYAVISVGEGNSYGHPADNTLSRLRDAEVTVYRTDLQGDIVCKSDGTNVTFSTDKNADNDAIMTAGTSNGSKNASESEEVKTETESAAANIKETEAQTVSEETTYILNTNTKKFHYPSCSSVKQMAEKNKKEYIGTREEVINQGYDPCKRCKP